MDTQPVGGLAAGAGFSVILGNPPFINAIEGGITESVRVLSRYVHARLGGTADLGYIFLDQSVLLVSPNGRVGIIQPRAVLNCSPVVELRRALRGATRPNLIYAPNRSDFFPGAAVFVCALVLGPEEMCRVSRDEEPATAKWSSGILGNENWWLELGRIIDGLPASNEVQGPVLSSRFEVAASMTTGDAYDVKPFVFSSVEGPGAKLITTGLIDPGECLWGKTMCRYLKEDFQFPRIHSSPDLSKSLQKRLSNAVRPKIIVAGLSKRVECFLDTVGEFIGAVSTYSIYHPANDTKALETLCVHLLSEDVSVKFRAELGGNAMGGGNTTMKKGFLEQLPIPESLDQGG